MSGRKAWKGTVTESIDSRWRHEGSRHLAAIITTTADGSHTTGNAAFGDPLPIGGRFTAGSFSKGDLAGEGGVIQHGATSGTGSASKCALFGRGSS